MSQLVCSLQHNSKVPAIRELGLECTPQQHKKCAQGEGKAPHASSWASPKNNESTTQRMNGMCHECIKTSLLLGVAKNKESVT